MRHRLANEGLPMSRIELSIVTPAFDEEANLPALYEELKTTLDTRRIVWEWIVVEDHSLDGTFEVVSSIAAADPRVRGIRLSRNCGAHVALICGLYDARGSAAVVMAADLQDPPEVIPELMDQWRAGVQIVWAARSERQSESGTNPGLSRLYWWLMRKMIKESTIPATGADFFLMDRRAIEALRRFDERNVSTLQLINSMGFRQAVVTYAKRARRHGRSGWTMAKKIKLVLDTVVSFSYLPIRAMSVIGAVTALLGIAYAAWVIVNALIGDPPVEGWSSLMVVFLILGGLQMLMLGMLGEYMWRNSENARRRPLYLIEAATPEDAKERLPGRTGGEER